MAKTTCYKCGSDIEVEDLTYVHPLCESCEEVHNLWFEAQLAKLDGV